MRVCAYSGCWEGVGEVSESGRFVLATGHDLAFSTSDDPQPGSADVAIVLDRADEVATLKVGEFAQPLLCERPVAAL